MSDYNELMSELVELGINANPVAPFTTCIIDSSGQILVTACNASHISPLYTAEGLALHSLFSHFSCRNNQSLTMLSTAEMDNASLLSLFSARCQGINITEIIYGASREQIKSVWCNEDPNLPMKDYLKNFPEAFRKSLNIQEPVLPEECVDAFSEAKEMWKTGNYSVKSKDIDQYWMTGDWLMDDWLDEM